MGDGLGAVQLPGHTQECRDPPARQGLGTGAHGVAWVSAAQVLSKPASRPPFGVIVKLPYGTLLAKFLNDLG